MSHNPNIFRLDMQKIISEISNYVEQPLQLYSDTPLPTYHHHHHHYHHHHYHIFHHNSYHNFYHNFYHNCERGLP